MPFSNKWLDSLFVALTCAIFAFFFPLLFGSETNLASAVGIFVGVFVMRIILYNVFKKD